LNVKEFVRHHNKEVETQGNAEDNEDLDFYDYIEDLKQGEGNL
jgi:hypothetical protein